MDNQNDTANLLILISSKINKVKRLTENAPNLETTGQQFNLLTHIKALEPCYLMDLSHETKVSKSSLSIMLNKLVEDGLVKREIDSNNRRKTFFSLTKKGLSFTIKERNLRINYIGNALQKISTDKQKDLIGSLTKLNPLLDSIINKLE